MDLEVNLQDTGNARITCQRLIRCFSLVQVAGWYFEGDIVKVAKTLMPEVLQ